MQTYYFCVWYSEAYGGNMSECVEFQASDIQDASIEAAHVLESEAYDVIDYEIILTAKQLASLPGSYGDLDRSAVERLRERLFKVVS